MQLIRPRFFSSCATIKDLKGNTFVAIVGGLFPESKGMEIWNPLDGSVKMMTDMIPPEIGAPAGKYTSYNFQKLNLDKLKSILNML